MRENKYRIWCKDKKEWEKDLCVLTPSGNLLHEICGRFVPLKMENHIIYFSSGLKDNNGIEIYKGDVVKYFDNEVHFAEVESVQELGTGMYLKAAGKGYYSLNPSAIKEYDVEVIGNVYDNPELLKEG